MASVLQIPSPCFSITSTLSSPQQSGGISKLHAPISIPRSSYTRLRIRAEKTKDIKKPDSAEEIAKKYGLEAGPWEKASLGVSQGMDQLQETTRKELKRHDLNPVSAMELIDTLQRLGISHHYEEEIDSRLGKLHEWDDNEHQDLRATSLRFRLLRQNARPVSSDVFKKFTKNGKFIQSLSQDREGLLHLYEASYLGTPEEELLLEAMKFSETQLKLSLENKVQTNLSWQIQHAMELPSHLRMKRLESRLYIDGYRKQTSHNPRLLDLAKYDYNQVQLMYQRDLAEFSRWWKELGLIEKVGSRRDRPTEYLLWTVGIVPEPKQATTRIELAKLIAILSVIDDIFDTHGTMDDLLLFMAAIQRWNLDTLDQLPDYMKICYMALYNNTNEIAFKVLKEHGKNI